MLKFTVLIVVQGALFSVITGQLQLRAIRQWKYVNYTWPNEETLQTATENGSYIPENVAIAGILHHDDWFYLTIPRMKNGVPATLGRVTAKAGGSRAPLIEPYPSWDFNKLDDCNALQNVQNVEVDAKGMMWIIDGGHTQCLTDAHLWTCPPKLVIFDIKNNVTVSVYTFPDDVASSKDNFLYDLVLDGDFAYITDNSPRDPGIIVFSVKENRAWKIRHPTMRADPAAQNFSINNVPITDPIPIAGIALGPKMNATNSKDREVFYCPLSSLHLYSISTSVLQDESNSNNGMDYAGDVRDVGVKASQTDGMVMSNHGVLYYGLLGDSSVAKWDSQTPFASEQKIVSRDPNYIQWTNAFTIDHEGNLTVLSNTLQKFVYEKLDLREHNFWLLSTKVGDKSYIYDDSSFDYRPIVQTKPVVQTKRVESNTTMHLYKPSHRGQTLKKSKIQTSTTAPDGANQQILELSVMLVAITAWIFNHN